MSKKYVAGCMNKIGIFYPMFRGTEDDASISQKNFHFVTIRWLFAVMKQ